MIIEAREDNITLRGAVTDNIWPAIQAAAALLLEDSPTGIIIDCSAITEYTPKGAETFADAFEYISARNARIVLAGLSPELLEVARSVPGVRSQLPIAATVEQARSSLQLVEMTPQRGRALNAGIVPVLGNWRRAVRLANKLALGENCEMHLVDLIKIPRTLPLGSPLPEREQQGQARLEEGKNIVKDMGIKAFTHVERVRSEANGLSDYVERLKADFSVVSCDKGRETAPQIDHAEARFLLESATYELSLIKASPQDYEKPIKNPIVLSASAWKHALEHACKLTLGDTTTVNVLCLITVPRSEPLNAPKPDAETAAADCSREAQRIARDHGMRVNATVERVRDPVIGFLKMLESGKYDAAFIGIGHETDADYHIAHSAAISLLQDAPCESIIVKMGENGTHI